MAVKHPDFGVLAARIAVSNLHKETKKRFSDVITDLRNCRNKVQLDTKIADFELKLKL